MYCFDCACEIQSVRPPRTAELSECCLVLHEFGVDDRTAVGICSRGRGSDTGGDLACVGERSVDEKRCGDGISVSQALPVSSIQIVPTST